MWSCWGELNSVLHTKSVFVLHWLWSCVLFCFVCTVRCASELEECEGKSSVDSFNQFVLVLCCVVLCCRSGGLVGFIIHSFISEVWSCSVILSPVQKNGTVPPQRSKLITQDCFCSLFFYFVLLWCIFHTFIQKLNLKLNIKGLKSVKMLPVLHGETVHWDVAAEVWYLLSLCSFLELWTSCLQSGVSAGFLFVLANSWFCVCRQENRSLVSMTPSLVSLKVS